jgi:hypothetical protein
MGTPMREEPGPSAVAILRDLSSLVESESGAKQKRGGL